MKKYKWKASTKHDGIVAHFKGGISANNRPEALKDIAYSYGFKYREIKSVKLSLT